MMSDLHTSENGLSSQEAAARLKKYGLNEIKEEKGISPIKIFFSQFKSFIVLILLAAMGISIFIGYNEYLQEGPRQDPEKIQGYGLGPEPDLQEDV